MHMVHFIKLTYNRFFSRALILDKMCWVWSAIIVEPQLVMRWKIGQYGFVGPPWIPDQFGVAIEKCEYCVQVKVDNLSMTSHHLDLFNKVHTANTN